MYTKIDNIKYRDKYIERGNEFGFSEEQILELIGDTDNPEYIDKYIERRKELGIEGIAIDLIVRIKDPQYVDKYIGKREEFGFNNKALVYLILGTSNTEYINKCIERREELGFNKEDILDLIIGTENPEFIDKCIQNREEFGLEKSDVMKIAIDNEKYIREITKQEGVQTDLPANMTIGIEIETVGKESKWLKDRKTIGGWKCKGDGSLKSKNSNETGVEVISPILAGNIVITEEVRKTCTILENLDQYTNETCGGHIHIGANYLTNVQAWKNLLELWANTEQALYIVSNEEGEIPRLGVPYYASPISGDLEELLGSGSINLEDETDLEKFQEKLVRTQEDRYKGINFKNLAQGGKGTIEFRLPNGAVDANTWIENINLFGGIVKSAQDLSVIQAKNISERTEQEQHLLECFEKIRNKELDEKETFEQLLEIVVPEKSRNSYRKRYETNSELLKQNPIIERGIRTKTAKGSVKISKNRIGKEIFTGEDRITGEENQQTEEVLSEEMKKMISFLRDISIE
ncbi:MAG: amidoligase family protein [Clostridia bacterium]|nr:amidoligase family protein [Clostridia bacterium]